MAFDIEIRNECPKARILRKPVLRVVRAILKELGFEQADLSILFVDDRKIRRLNRSYFRHDRPTDVIAFSQLEGKQLLHNRLFLGDVVISIPTTRRQAKEYGNSFYQELFLYLCHGILHLLGYEDKTPQQARRMEKKQREILKKISTRG